MTKKPEDKDEHVLLKIEDAMSVYEAAVVRERLMACLDNCDGLSLDLSELKDCDIAGVQLLYSAKRTAEDQGKYFKVAGASDSVVDALARAGINPDQVLCAGKEE